MAPGLLVCLWYDLMELLSRLILLKSYFWLHLIFREKKWWCVIGWCLSVQGTRRPGSGSQRPCQPATSGHWINIHSFLEPTLAHCLGHRIKMAERIDHKIYLLFPTRLINSIISGKNVIVANIRWISDQNEFPMEMSIKGIIPSGNASLAWSHKGPRLRNRFLVQIQHLEVGL